MLRISIVICFLLFFSSARADHKAIVEVSSEVTKVSLGDSFWAKIYLVFEKENVNVGEYLNEIDLTKMSSEQFDVVEMGEKKISENNHDVIEADVLLLFKKEVENQAFVFKLDDSFFYASLKGFSFEKSDTKPTQGYIVLDTLFSSYLDLYKYRFILILLFILTCCYGIKFLRRHKNKKEILRYKKELQKKWSGIIKNTHGRNEYEYIIRNFDLIKKSLREVFDGNPKLKEKESLLDVFVIGNKEFFYQKDWDQKILEKINHDFNYLRDIFDGEFRI